MERDKVGRGRIGYGRVGYLWSNYECFLMVAMI